VFSSLLPTSEKTGHNIYTSSKSSTYKALSGYTWYVILGFSSIDL
jgi:aspergillopepsin I